MTQEIVHGLPSPSAEEREHSDKLRRAIRSAIDNAGGLIPFSQFMQLALYSAGGGYYASGSVKFGEQGDFITAPELGSLFARCLAKQIAQVLNQVNGGEILEVGAGSGALALQLLRTLSAQNELPPRYQILETSAELSHRQHELLAKHVPHLLHHIEWISQLPDKFNGVILANEVVDAIPVDRFTIINDQVQGVGVAWGQDGFRDAAYTVTGSNWNVIRNLNLPENYCSEAGFQREAWMRSIGACLQSGAVIIVDYGFPRHEYFHPQRSGGTLMCHYRHRSHFDPYLYVGLQDITAHVDFTALADGAAASGLSLAGFTSLASFLLALGILDIIEPIIQTSTIQHVAIAQEVKKLTLPSEMGELFKVLAVGKNLRYPLEGFAHSDRRGRLL